MFEKGFPKQLYKEVHQVSTLITRKTYHNISIMESPEVCQWSILNGETVHFPYRIYILDTYEEIDMELNATQKLIYHCLFSRNCDGFIRQKHMKKILSRPFPTWVIPYIIKVSDEYVVEILEDVYADLLDKNCDDIKLFCRRNMPDFLHSHDRMISYWNEFYRGKCFRYKDYVGRKLFSECFGYSRFMEQLR